MNLVNCDYCGIMTSDYIEVIAEDFAGIIMCEDCSNPIDEKSEESFYEWWKQFEEYQKLKTRGRNGFDRVDKDQECKQTRVLKS